MGQGDLHPFQDLLAFVPLIKRGGLVHAQNKKKFRPNMTPAQYRQSLHRVTGAGSVQFHVIDQNALHVRKQKLAHGQTVVPWCQ